MLCFILRHKHAHGVSNEYERGLQSESVSSLKSFENYNQGFYTLLIKETFNFFVISFILFEFCLFAYSFLLLFLSQICLCPYMFIFILFFAMLNVIEINA